MSKLNDLLNKRLFWLEKFLKDTESFVESIIRDPESGDIERFTHNRNTLLKIIARADDRIHGFILEKYNGLQNIPIEQKHEISYYNERKREIIQKINSANAKVMEQMEAAQNIIAEKLKSLKRGRTAISKYKTSETKNDKLDKTL